MYGTFLRKILAHMCSTAMPVGFGCIPTKQKNRVYKQTQKFELEQSERKATDITSHSRSGTILCTVCTCILFFSVRSAPEPNQNNIREYTKT